MLKNIWLQFSTTDLNTEVLQLTEEGRDLSSVQAEIEELRTANFDDMSVQNRFLKFMQDGQNLPIDATLAGKEPNDLETIKSLRPADRFQKVDAPSDIAEKLRGAWLGRAAGCLLGKPLEGYRSKFVDPLLIASDNLPLHRYLRSDDGGSNGWDELFGENVWSSAFLIDRCDGMPEDDDMNYTVTGLAIVEKYGRDFTNSNVAEFWLTNIPALHTCTAERVAYRNFLMGIAPPESATHCNPYREWIGAQIRADFWGYINPGDPEKAAEMAWRDASISHVRNGIYGEMWAAACIASAFTTTDIPTILRAGLGEIPAECRLAHALKQAEDWYAQGLTLREVIMKVREQYDEIDWHPWTHTITNAVIVVIGLLWGEGDYGKTICAAVEPMYDTDCNGATAGSIFGAAYGPDALQAQWIEPLKDTLETGVKGYEKVALSALAAKTLKHLPG